MARQFVRLGPEELRHVLGLCDAVELVAATLTGQVTGHTGDEVPHACQLVPAPETVPASVPEPVAIEDALTGTRGLLSASGLGEVRAAVLVVLAARALMVPGVVTAAVVGPTSAVRLYVAMVTRHVPDISCIAVCTVGDQEAVPVDLAELDQLDRAGISLSVTTTVDEAVFGANLLVIADLGNMSLRLDQLARGALLVNVSGRDLPYRLERGVDAIYVDDVRLLAVSRHRRFVRMHFDEPGTPADQGWGPEEWHRGRGRGRVAADLGQVLAGQHPGRRLDEEILLVDLLGEREPDIALACLLQRAAVEHGVGTWHEE